MILANCTGVITFKIIIIIYKLPNRALNGIQWERWESNPQPSD